MLKQQTKKTLLNGLVLSGGRSTRLGQDKGALHWHGKEHRLYIAGLLQPFCDKVYISCRKEQSDVSNKNYEVITDTYENIGPYGGLLSAFAERNDCAWLVIACDLPFLDNDTLLQLVEERDCEYMATAFKNPGDNLPEPLAAIWEPHSFNILLSSLSKGCQSLRKVLMNNNAKIIGAQNGLALMNVNTTEEFEDAQRVLKMKNKHAV